jgi:hypothetical protein
MQDIFPQKKSIKPTAKSNAIGSVGGYDFVAKLSPVV